MAKTTFTVDEVTKAFIAGTQFGSKIMRDSAKYFDQTGKELNQDQVTNETMVTLQVLLTDLGYKPEEDIS